MEKIGFLKKLVNILVLTLWSRLHLLARKTDQKMSYKFLLCGNPQNNSFRTKHYVTLCTFVHHQVEEDLEKMKVRNWREKCKDRKIEERNRKAGQNPPRVVAPTEEKEEDINSGLTH